MNLFEVHMDFTLAILLGGLVLLGVLLIPVIVARFLTTVDAGTIRLVTGRGKTTIYKGPGKAIEIPIFTTGTTIPAKAINIDLEVADQTADVDRNGQPRPIKVRVLASAIVSVGDSNEMIQTAANRFFSKPLPEQTSTLTDLLTSTGRRAINLLHHDELFNSRVGAYDDASPLPVKLGIPAEEDDRLAIIIKSSCSRELQDLGLVFNSLNIKEVQSEVAEARRRQSAVEAKANADIVTADQERRSREAQLGAEQAVNDKMRDLERRRAENAAQIAEAETAKQVMLGGLREAELRATQIAKATADSEQLKIQTVAAAEAEAMRIRMLAAAQADAIRLVNDALSEGGNGYLKLKQLEMLPAIAPRIADALAEAKMVTFSSDGQGAPSGTVDQISNVIQMVLATQLVQNTPLANAPAKPEPENSSTKPVVKALVESAPPPVPNFEG
ncbi:MAG: SPFH domain-containing protein [Fimbriimonadaceae bacterium]